MKSLHISRVIDIAHCHHGSIWITSRVLSRSIRKNFTIENIARVREDGEIVRYIFRISLVTHTHAMHRVYVRYVCLRARVRRRAALRRRRRRPILQRGR